MTVALSGAPSCGHRILLPKQKRAGGGASTLLYVELELELVDQTSFLRRRRAKPTSPPQAITRPGSPAPTTGPGTGLPKSMMPVLPLLVFNTSAAKNALVVLAPMVA